MTQATGTYNDITIVFNDNDQAGTGASLINLTQMHKAADGRMSQAPAMWFRQKDTKEFIKTLCKKLNMPEKHIKKSTRGKVNGGTYAHWQIALAYAKYLSPEFHIWWRDVIDWV